MFLANTVFAFLIPLLGVFISGYVKIKGRTFLGIALILSACAILESFLVANVYSLVAQVGVVVIGFAVMFLLIGFLGDKASPRSAFGVFSAIGLFPFGVWYEMEEYKLILVYLLAVAIFSLMSFIMSGVKHQSGIFIRRRWDKSKYKDDKPQRRYFMHMAVFFLIMLMFVVTASILGFIH